MRAASALIAALVLTACQVNVEGAPCSTPGQTTDCPGGQACGNDGKCSERAAGCVAASVFCSPGTSAATSPKQCGHSPEAIETCTGADSVCGAWAVLPNDSCSTGLVCDAPAGSPACVCATPTSEIRVDTTAPTGSLVPTGAAQPPECQFKTLTDALAYARTKWLLAHPASTVNVIAAGAPTGSTPVLFSAETFPLNIPRGVTLGTVEVPSNPADWVIAAPAGSTDLVHLQDGATVDGFTVRTTTATGDGIVAQCGAGATTAPTLRNVIVDGGGTLNRGVVVTGTCGLTANQLGVSGAAHAGLHVDAPPGSVGVAVTGGSFKNNGGSGVEMVSGSLAIAGTDASTLFDISANAQYGVLATPAAINPQAINVSIDLADIHANGEVGVLVKSLVATGSTVSITSSLIRKNAAAATVLSLYGTGRTAGGMLLWGSMPITQGTPPAPAFVFMGNTLCSNSGDAIGVYSNDGWPLSGGGCTDGTNNVFVNPGSYYYVYSTTTGSDIPASNNRWAPDPPTGLVIKAAYVPSCGAVVTTPAVCN